MNAVTRTIFLLFGAYTVSISANDSEGLVTAGLESNNTGSTQTDNRAERFLSLFTVVRFSNGQCTGSNGLMGTCQTAAECSAAGGTSSGSCAAGFGVCCVYTFSACGSMSSRNCTYFTTGTLSATSASQSCTYMVNKCSDDICQMRVDFLSFEIAQPSTTLGADDMTGRPTAGSCLQDQFTVLNSAYSYAPICGFNTGQHMYYDVVNTQSIKLMFLLTTSSTNTNPTRTWNIKVTQIPCYSYNNLAPAGCLQYFTEPSGMFMSFNWNTVTTTSSFHLANQDYSVCFRMETNYCSICYTVCDTADVTVPTSFGISGGTDGMTATMSGADIANCMADYVLIPSAYNQGSTTPTTDRLCGQLFNALLAGSNTHATVCSSTKPFRFYFKTSADETVAAMMEVGADNTAGAVGFCLKYTQTACSVTGK